VIGAAIAVTGQLATVQPRAAVPATTSVASRFSLRTGAPHVRLRPIAQRTAIARAQAATAWMANSVANALTAAVPAVAEF
jgi:hypothetical protein